MDVSEAVLTRRSVRAFTGLAIGYRESDEAANIWERERVPLEDHIKFVGF